MAGSHGKSPHWCCHNVLSDILYIPGETMRIFFSVAIAFLFAILAAGASGVHAMDRDCHEERQVAEVMDNMAGIKCCCLSVPEMVCKHSWSRIQAMADCCPSQECGGFLLIREAVLSANTQAPEFITIAQKTIRSFSVPRLLPGASRIVLPPPRLPAVPRYMQHCSFLI